MKGKLKKKGKKRYIILGGALLLALIAAFLAVLKVDDIVYEGNERLTEEELNGYFSTDGYLANPLIFMFKYWFGEKQEIPFVEEYEIELKGLNSVSITIYEKSIVGYISYMNTFMYFDKDGIVVENSHSEYEDVPEVTGIDFENIVLYNKIPVKNNRIFALILNVTQLVDKYGIKVSRINISDDMSATLYIGSFRVALGNSGAYGEKIASLSDILPSMQDIPGELDMREYNTKDTGYIFKKD